MWFTGSLGRHRRSEEVLPRLVKKGKLRAEKYGFKIVYIAPKYKKLPRVDNIDHGLGISKALARYHRSDINAEIIPSREFRGMGSIPEFGMKFNSVMLYEFCTRSNYYAVLHKKIRAYEKNLFNIEDKFGKCFVLFVCDVKREYVRNFQPKPEWALFTDYETFKSVPIGNQLTASIYFWSDGKEYPIRGH